jgi:predicted 2-oxoglutarate/Fe(II)-dependent dioxygenase YbiX
LNDDFAGGATAFAQPDIAISPLGGVAVVFSPVLLHRAEPVTSGTKYAITAWYHVPPAA